MNTHPENRISSKDRKIKGVFRGTTSTGGALTLLDRDGNTITIRSNERVLLTYVQISVSAAGDFSVYFDNDAGDDLDNNEAIVRGTAPTNGAIVVAQFDDPVLGGIGDDVRCTCASGTIDVIATGYILQ